MTDTATDKAADEATGNTTQPAADTKPTDKPQARKRALLILGVVVLVGLIVWAVFHFLLAKPEEETDDAYVAGDVVAVTARDPGTVLALHADNTQAVKAGQPLIDLDPTTADVNLASAEAELARAVRATRADFTRVGQSDAGIVQAQAELARARDDYARRRGAAAQGAVSGEELDHAADAVKVATANLRLAQEQRRQAQSAVQGTDVDTNPAVMAAKAAYRRAAIVRGHMRVIAPITGVVAQRTVQVGQQVNAGMPLMAIVPLDRLWVDANFRETQLKDLRIGQPATVVADVYGGDVVYHGRVVGVGAGSGNAFALLPPQNASGNWIKIVQRVPVRIALNPQELRANPLRVGLSVKATVDTANLNGGRLAQVAAAPYRGDATVGTTPEVEARIRRIVAANR
ncbi:HlyD family efflux transporter periplasmic adaptor subunit [Sphingomonas adhaesiva]|uniref:HlyD family efflux transporter periplasmic adaptor subunit n=1 Tax=Sphingomonas adhaesiva TaxID=28212 RepID=UPI002FFC8312